MQGITDYSEKKINLLFSHKSISLTKKDNTVTKRVDLA